ncbi:hypothetical protein [Amycolatopsis sp. lyj-112]|uniref:hypothetical protein n=1 Tax=Amycolatopsis sp. lyj-112 TaxID=2789288 RepID=UPI003978EAE5
MNELAHVADTLKSAVLKAANRANMHPRDVGRFPALEFQSLGRDDEGLYRASADLSDEHGSGYVHILLGRSSGTEPITAEQLRATGASCAEVVEPDGTSRTSSTWTSPDSEVGVITYRVVVVLPDQVFVDIQSANQDSRSSGQTRPEPPFDLDELTEITSHLRQ